MLEDDRWSVVARCVIVAETVDRTGQRSVDRCSRRRANVNANVDRAPFGAVVSFDAEQVGRVDRAHLVITPDANARVRCGKFVIDEPRETTLVTPVVDRADRSAGDAEIVHVYFIGT